MYRKEIFDKLQEHISKLFISLFIRYSPCTCLLGKKLLFFFRDAASLAHGLYIPDTTFNVTELDISEFNISNYEDLVGEYGDYGDYSGFETKSEADMM